MSATTSSAGGAPSPTVPSSAPVLEYKCMYTREVKRKKPRLKDGFLRYHSFNKRALLYDDKHNLIGDTYWTAAEPLQEGDEVRLEGDGAIAEVGELASRSDTDLSEIVRTRKNLASVRFPAPSRPLVQTPVTKAPSMTASGYHALLKHRSLNALLGNSNGPLGKAALPNKSPFELRREASENAEWMEGKAPKRRRLESINGPTIERDRTELKVPAPEAMLRLKPTIKPNVTMKRDVAGSGQHKRQNGAVIASQEDGCQSVEQFLPGLSSGALASSPPKTISYSNQLSPYRSSSPAFHTLSPLESAEGTSARPSERERDTTRQRPASNGPKNASCTNRNGKASIKSRPPKEDVAAVEREPVACPTAPSNAAPKPKNDHRNEPLLHIAVSESRRKSLLCKDQLISKSKRTISLNTDDAVDAFLDVTDELQPQKPSKTKTQREQFAERLAKRREEPKHVSSIGSNGGASAADNDEASRIDGPLMEHKPAGGITERLRTRHHAVSPSNRELSKLGKEDEQLGAHTSPSFNNPDPTPNGATKYQSISTQRESGADRGARKTQSRRKKGIGRKEIRISAEACFQNTPKPPDGAPEPINAAPTTSSTTPQLESERQHEVTSLSAGDYQNIHRNLHENLPTSRPMRSPNTHMRFTSHMSNASHADDHDAAIGHDGEDPVTFDDPAPAKTSGRSLQHNVKPNMPVSGTADITLNESSRTSRVVCEIDREIPVAVPVEPQPWSREAFDLFAWRPPNWDEERWCFGGQAGARSVA